MSEEGSNGRILVVDDDPEVRALLRRLLAANGFLPEEAGDGREALSLILSRVPSAMILDFRMEGMDGVGLLAHLAELGINLPVVMLTAYPSIRMAVDAVKLGAVDYLTKPFDHDEILGLLARALGGQSPPKRAYPVQERSAIHNLREAMGHSRAIQELALAVARVAGTKLNVLIIGETGVGKELIARAVHGSSGRANGPFVAVDCGAIPESLAENELFGHTKGAFTGAFDRAGGRFEEANRGTLFLDEIPNLPLGIQAKVLRVLETRRPPVLGRGGQKNLPAPVDIRVLAASNVPFEELIEAGRFRADLFYRLNQFTLRIPPLRERTEDIPYLCERALGVANAESGRNVREFSTDAMDLLTSHDWPGNVRELCHVIGQAVIMADDRITAEHLRITKKVAGVRVPHRGVYQWTSLPLREIVHRHVVSVEQHVVLEALRVAGGNKAKAARMLKVDYKTIQQKLKTYGIQAKQGGGSSGE